MMRRRRSHPTVLILPARTAQKKVAGKDSLKKLAKGLLKHSPHTELFVICNNALMFFCSSVVSRNQ